MIAFAGNTASVIYTVESSGALAAADSGPTYTLYKNGSVVDTTSGTPTVTLTASTIATGVYRVSYTVPGSGFAVNDVLELFAATGSTGSAVVGRWVILPASLLTLPSFPTNFASLGISVGGAISNVTTAGSVTSGVTLAATTHTGATIPTVTTVTNLTNAPTSGDLTATMKASVTAAVPSVTQIRTEMDTNSTQLAAISAAVDLVKAKTDNLPASPAAVGSAMTLTSAYDAAKTAASQTSVDAVKTDTGNLVNRITANLFSGITYLGRWLGLLAGKTADSTTLAEINATTAGATYSNVTDSLEAIRDRGDTSWSSGGSGLTGANLVTITVDDGSNPVPGAYVRLKAGAETEVKRTDADGVVTFTTDDNTFSVRIMSPGLTFEDVSLAVTADTTITYSMDPVATSTDSWATGEDLAIFYDVSTIGQMLNDNRTVVQAADVPNHPVVNRILQLATGEVNSALMQSNRYSWDQLRSMSASSLEHLKNITCAVAVWHFFERRMTNNPDKQEAARKLAELHLERLRRGETVLGIESAQEAGIGEAVTFTQADQQRGTPLLRDRMSGTQGVFPSRRFNPRSGQ
jgi:hypothetical protein